MVTIANPSLSEAIILAYSALSQPRGGGGAPDPIIAQLPAGAVGVWIMDKAETGARVSVPNLAAPASAASVNLISPSRRMFVGAVNIFWNKQNVVATDSVEAGPTGAMDASSIVSTGANDWRVSRALTLPAGVYTMALSMKSRTGSTQSVRMMDAGTTTHSVTTSWGRFARTFTHAGGLVELYFCRSVDGATAGDIAICDATLHAGAVDLGRDVFDGRMYVGRDAFDTIATISGGAYVPGATGIATAQFDSDLSFSQATVIYVARRTRTTGSGFSTVLGAATPAYPSPLWSVSENAAAPTSFFGATDFPTYAGSSFYPALWSFLNNGWFSGGMVYDGSRGAVWLNDARLFGKTFSTGAVTPKDFWIGSIGLGASNLTTTDLDIAAIALYPRALTDAEYRQAYDALVARVASASSITVPARPIVVLDGDSIAVGTSASGGGYFKRAAPNLSPVRWGYNAAVSGSRLSDLASRASSFINAIPRSNGEDRILAVHPGYNDYNQGMSTSAFLSAYAVYYTAAKAAGWSHLMAVAILPGSAAGQEAWRNTVNAALAGGVGTYCDSFCNFDIVTGTGSTAATWQAANLVDGVHPNDAGYAALEPVFTTDINAI